MTFSVARWQASHTNGKIPRADMLEIPGQGIDPDTGLAHIMQPDAAENMIAMIRDARTDGVVLALSRSYRPYPIQQIKYRNYLGPDGVAGTSDDGTLAAVPGRSNHGWGLAVDFQIPEYPAAWSNEDFRWLRNNARRFGFHNNDASTEPWHWDYEGGGPGLPEEVDVVGDELLEGVNAFLAGKEPKKEGPARKMYRALTKRVQVIESGDHTHDVTNGETGPAKPE